MSMEHKIKFVLAALNAMTAPIQIVNLLKAKKEG